MSNTLESLQTVAKYLARFSEQIKILNNSGEFSLNIVAENILIELFNETLGGNYVNVNNTIGRNFPGIDLLDKNNKIAIQITSQASLSKIKKTISSFFDNDLHTIANQLFVYVITDRQAKYSQVAIDKHINDCIQKLIKKRKVKSKSEVQFKFSGLDNVWDKKNFHDKLQAAANIDQQIRVAFYLQKQFGIIEEKANLKKYYQSLKNQYYDIVMNDDKGMTLNEVYVEPLFEVFRHSMHPLPKQESSEDFIGIKNISLNKYIVENLLNNVSIIPNLKKSNISIVLGYPGQGKTSFCKKVLNDYINTDNQKNIFFVKLKDITDGKNFVESPLTILLDFVCTQSEQNISKQSLKKSILILDGLDELYMKESMRLDDVERLCRELRRETESNKELKIIITSRYGYLETEKLIKDDILIFQLSSFNLNQQLEWLNKYLRFHPETWLSKEKIKALYPKKKYDENYLAELMGQPILLHLIATLNNEIGKDTTRSVVYNQLFTELIERNYSIDGPLENLRNFNKDDIRQLIREIAFGIHINGGDFISKKDALTLKGVQKYLNKFPNKDFKENLKGVMISFYFKESEKGVNEKSYAIEFLHRSFYEYMTAEKIVSTIEDKFLNKDQRGGYILEDDARALALFQELFSKEFSNEIVDNISELIDRIEITRKRELANRLFGFFEYSLKKDFLGDYNSEISDEPINIALNTFLGYWHFLMGLDENKNYLKNHYCGQKVANNLRILMNGYYSVSHRMNISNQDFTGLNLQNIYVIGSGGCVNTVFENAELGNSQFIDQYLNRVNLSNMGESYNVRFYDCTLIDCDLSGTSISGWVFENCSFHNVNFSSTEISSTQFINCKIIKGRKKDFQSIEGDRESLKSFLRIGARKYTNKVEVTFYQNGKFEVETISDFNSFLK
ncbi:MAG: Peptide deformylase [Bacteroidetes bacterium]|nr:Peptide deformylase [Bacteroidota bacterium]